MLSAAACITLVPTSVEPVNEHLRHTRVGDQRAPVVEPGLRQDAERPLGKAGSR